MAAIERKTLRNILAADIGGTHSRFAHFTADKDGELSLISHIWLKTAEADSFASLLKNLKESRFPLNPQKADTIGIAIAGPVIDGVRSDPPLIAWGIDISNAKSDYGFQRCFLINDFVAQAFACISPAAKSAEAILDGISDAQSAIAVIGAGTGLGKAILAPDGRGGYSAVPSEGAHASFPFVGKEEFAFQQFILRARKTHYATFNHVLSGAGLSAIHEFLTGAHLKPAKVVEQFTKYPQTLSWAARFYGRACRDFALDTLSLGGLYIAGGIAARNPGILLHESFRSEFLDSDTMSHILRRMPVFLISDQNSGLWGVAEKAAREAASFSS